MIAKAGVTYTCQCGAKQTLQGEHMSYAPPSSPWRQGWEREVIKDKARYIFFPDCGHVVDGFKDGEDIEDDG